jgi:hypothetical protein
VPAEDPPYFIGEPRKGYFTRHGVQWKETTKLIQLELACFREKMAGRMPRNHGGVGPAWHFKAVAMALWPEDAPEGQPRFIWHRWADLMLVRSCQNEYLAVAGSGGGGKSEFFAVWLIIQFLCDPANTICLATSITVSISKKKMWGKIVQYWTPLEKMGFPGKLVDSLHIIRYVDVQGVAIKGDMAGIALITGEKKKEKEAVGRIIGIHQERIVFCADDLTELSEAITEAAFYNLSRGCSYFGFIGIANPLSYFDPFGKFAMPIKGWESITVEDSEWRTERGLCIHLDTLKNPRITDGDERLTWMDSQEDIDKEIAIKGANSASFWRMFRGFWCPSGIVELVYSEIEIIGCHANQKVVWRDELNQHRVSFLDPSFTSGGDRTIACFGTLGINDKGLKCLQYDGYETFQDDATSLDTTRSQQVIQWWKQLCEQKFVAPRHAGFDSTGAGGPFGDLVDILWSKEVLKVNFAGKASDKPVSAFDPTPCNERYANRVTEIWYSLKEAMRSGQIRGLCPEVIQEMCTRKKSDEKGQQLLIRLQTKRDMMLHNDRSPDLSDAHVGLVELCCERLGLSSAVATRRQYPQEYTKPFKEIFKKYDAFADNKRRFAIRHVLEL